MKNNWDLTMEQKMDIASIEDNNIFIIDGRLFCEGPAQEGLASLGIPFKPIAINRSLYAVRDDVFFRLRELYTAGEIPKEYRPLFPNNAKWSRGSLRGNYKIFGIFLGDMMCLSDIHYKRTNSKTQ